MDIRVLKDELLFRGMETAEIEECLKALSGRTRRFPKDAVILRAGEAAERDRKSVV